MKRLKRVFTTDPMIYFFSARLLRSCLGRINLYPLEKTVVSVQRKAKSYRTCHNVKETETFTSTTTSKKFKINHRLNCNYECLDYLLTSRFYLKQYVSTTVEKFRYRWKNHKSNDRSYQEYCTCMQQHGFCNRAIEHYVIEHFFE